MVTENYQSLGIVVSTLSNLKNILFYFPKMKNDIIKKFLRVEILIITLINLSFRNYWAYIFENQ